MASGIQEVKEELHSMRSDLKDTNKAITDLVVVLTRKEENDKHLQGKVAKQGEVIDALEKRIRKCEDFITRSSPWVTLASRVVIAVIICGALIWMGLK